MRCQWQRPRFRRTAPLISQPAGVLVAVPRGPQRTTEFTVLTKRRVQPEDRAATVRLGHMYLGLNRLRGAREQFQSVLSVFPVLSRQGLGEVALRQRRFEEAIVVGLAILLAQKERFGEAVTLLDDADRQYPDRVATATTARATAGIVSGSVATRRQACTRSRHTRVRDGSDAGARRNTRARARRARTV